MRVDIVTLLLVALAGVGPARAATPAVPVDETTLPFLIIAANDGLRAQGMDYQIEGVEFLDGRKERVSVQLHRQDYGWVLGDPRRTDGQMPGLNWAVDRTWMVDSAHGSAFLNLIKAAQRAGLAWNQAPCAGSQVLLGATPPEADLTIFDALLGRGGFGTPLRADIVVGGFRPDLQPVFGPNTLAFTVTFVFVDSRGEITDIDRDGRMDTAAAEIYLNEALSWQFNPGPQYTGYDVATVLIHELGHALGLPHFGAPPVAAMNPTYRGSNPNLSGTDYAALCALYEGTGLYAHGGPVNGDGAPLD